MNVVAYLRGLATKINLVNGSPKSEGARGAEFTLRNTVAGRVALTHETTTLEFDPSDMEKALRVLREEKAE